MKKIKVKAWAVIDEQVRDILLNNDELNNDGSLEIYGIKSKAIRSRDFSNNFVGANQYKIIRVEIKEI
jgi:hypothetical protein